MVDREAPESGPAGSRAVRVGARERRGEIESLLFVSDGSGVRPSRHPSTGDAASTEWPGMPHDNPPQNNPSAKTRRAGAGPAAIALVMGLAALTSQASEGELVRDIQRYCTACWRNARLDPGLWDDCTQEVCCRLLGKARAGQLDLNLVLGDETPE